MTDDDVTPTNVARLSRESIDRQRGELPEAPPGSVAERFGYASADHPAAGSPVPVTRRAARIRQDLVARRAWLDWRRGGMGAGDIAIVMGWGFAGSSEYRLWGEKVGLIPADESTNELFDFGHRMEGPIADWFEEQTGLYVGSEQEQRVHPEVDWARATIDGEVFEGPSSWTDHPGEMPGEPIGGIEIKTASSFGWKAGDPIPDMYVCQGQWQMFVCGWERVWFAVLHEHRFRTYLLERDDEDIAILRARAERFWVDHVLTGDPPPVDSSPATRTALTLAYPGDREHSTAFLTDHDESLAMLREAKHQVDTWKRTAALYENVIKEQMGDATYADFGRGTEVTWARFSQRRVDTKLLKAHYPEVWDAVAKPVESSRFTVAGVKEEDD